MNNIDSSLKNYFSKIFLSWKINYYYWNQTSLRITKLWHFHEKYVLIHIWLFLTLHFDDVVQLYEKASLKFSVVQLNRRKKRHFRDLFFLSMANPGITRLRIQYRPKTRQLLIHHLFSPNLDLFFCSYVNNRGLQMGVDTQLLILFTRV